MPHDRESGPDSKIVDIKKAKKDRQQTTVPIMHNVRAVVESMLFNPHVTMPEFPHRLYVSEDQKGDAIIYQENDGGVVSMISDEKAIGLVSKFCQENCKYEHGMEKINYAHAGVMFKMWRARAPKLPPVADVLQLSQPGLTLSRLPFDFKTEASVLDCPLFSELMSRTTNAEAFMVWIGSLFDPEAYAQQYVWVRGEGGDGKSTLLDILHEVFGTAGFGTRPPSSERFWTINLVGKRLVVFSDCNNAGFVRSGLFKSLTGGDAIEVEIKNGPCFNVKMRAKYIFSSNKRPRISSEAADMRRIIYCEVAPHAGLEDVHYKRKMAAELPWILGLCWDLYREKCGSGYRIKSDNAQALELAASTEEKHELLFDLYFEEASNTEYINISTIQQIFKERGINCNKEQSDFYEYIERAYGVTRKKSVCDDGKQRRFLYGIRLKK